MTMPFKVTEVHIHRVPQYQGLIAMVKIVLSDSIVIDGIGIHEKRHEQGYRLTYPNRRLNNGNTITVAHPIKQSLSKAIEKAVFKELSLIQKDVEPHDRYRSADFR